MAVTMTLTREMEAALSAAQRSLAAIFRHAEIRPEHLVVWGLATPSRQVVDALRGLGKDATTISTDLRIKLMSPEDFPRVPGDDPVTPTPGAALTETLNEAARVAAASGQNQVELRHVLVASAALLDIPATDLAAAFDLTLPTPRPAPGPTAAAPTAAPAAAKTAPVTAPAPAAPNAPAAAPATGKGTGKVAPLPAALAKYADDLTARASAGQLDPVIGRDTELRRIVQVLCRRRKSNPILLGDPGVGKTAVIEGLALRLAADEVPEGLRGKRLISLDLALVVSGASAVGQLEARLTEIAKALEEHADTLIAFIDEIHTLMGIGGGGMGAADILKPVLARGGLRVIGATTVDEHRKFIAKDPALDRRFQPITVEAPSVEDTVTILRGLKPAYEVHHGVRIADAAVVAAATLSDRYLTDRNLPDKAIDLMDEAASRLRISIDSLPEPIEHAERSVRVLELERVALAAEAADDIASAARLATVEAELDRLHPELDALRAQWQIERAAIDQVRALKRDAAELRRASAVEENLEKVSEILHRRLPAVEAELARAEAALEASGSSLRVLREQVEADDIAQVVAAWTGVPAGRVSGEQASRLTGLDETLAARVIGQPAAVAAVSTAVRRNRAGLGDPERPVGSFLFTGPPGVGKTELARALAASVFDDESALLRLDMSEFAEKHAVARLVGAPPGYVGYDAGGQLTEAVRRRPYAVVLLDEVEKAHPDVFDVLLQVLDAGRLTDGQGKMTDFSNAIIILTSNLPDPYAFFRPELLDRLDETVEFAALDPANVGHIVTAQLRQVAARAAARGVTLTWTGAAVRILATEGYHAAFGARRVKRTVQRMVTDPLASELLEGRVEPGAALVLDADAAGTGLRFTPAAA